MSPPPQRTSGRKRRAPAHLDDASPSPPPLTKRPRKAVAAAQAGGSRAKGTRGPTKAQQQRAASASTSASAQPEELLDDAASAESAQVEQALLAADTAAPEQPGAASGSAIAAAPAAASVTAPAASLAAPTAATHSRSPSPVIAREAPEEIELSASPSPQPEAPGVSALAALPRDELEAHLPAARARVLQLLSGSLPPPHDGGADCFGLYKQWTDLRGALFSTVAMGEGNSALIVGTRGTGKSLLLHSALRSLPADKPFHHVHLDAAVQTTDALAMRELARQLVHAGAITVPDQERLGLTRTIGGLDDDEDEASEVSDDEEVEDQPGDKPEATEEELKEAVAGAVLSSIATTTSTLLTLLSGAPAGALPLVISLGTFDAFTPRPRQALLYVLLDAVQAGSYAPGLAVIGMTSRLDTTDLLEKRVRSRFSGRSINVYPPTAAAWQALAQRALEQGFSPSPDASAFNAAWKSDCYRVFGDKAFQQMLRGQHELSADTRALYRILTVAVSAISPASPALDPRAFVNAALVQRADTTDSVLGDLTTPEFALLVAAKHLATRDRSVFNFEMCFAELSRWAKRAQREREGAGTGGLGLVGDGSTSGARRTVQRSGGGKEGGALADRHRAMMSFNSLLELELFLPDAMFATISHLPGPQAGSAALARTARGAVRTEYLRVRCALDGPVIARAARSRARREALSTSLIQWATSAGG